MQTRNQSLDALRGVAVMMVLLYHYRFDFWMPISKFGWAGVDLFFVLSGFLVSGLLFTEYAAHGQINFTRFILRRGFKIWPAFYFYIAIVACFTFLPLPQPLPIREFADAALFIRNYCPGNLLVLRHLWSLAVEEHFYLVIAGIFALLIRRGRLSVIPFVWIGVMAWCLVARTFLSSNIFATHCRIDGLFTGVALRYIYQFRRSLFDRLSRSYSLLLSALCCAPILFLDVNSSRFLRTVGLSLLAIGFGLLMAWSVDRRPTTSLSVFAARGLAVLGRYSYSIYLWQFMAFFAATTLPSSIRFPTYIATALLLGIGTARLIEFPVLRVRDRLLHTPRTPDWLFAGDSKPTVVTAISEGAA